jgi:hypothetical protein
VALQKNLRNKNGEFYYIDYIVYIKKILPKNGANGEETMIKTY